MNAHAAIPIPDTTVQEVHPLRGRSRGEAHAVVIGSGFGGLAAAIRLGARGYRVTVLERLDAPGGRAYVHRQDGFTFDAGPTIVTAPFLFEELWQLCGKRLEDEIQLKPVDPFYRIRFHDGRCFDYSGDPERMRGEIERFSPDDVPGFEQFMETSRAIYKVGFEQLGHVPFSSWRDMARVVPQLLRLQSYRSVYSMAAKHVRDPQLRTVLSFHPLLVGGNPFRVTSIYSLIAFLEREWGVHFVMGGTGRLVEKLVGLIEGQGNVLRYGQEVKEILLQDRKAIGVQLANGERVRADVVVSNADAAWTYSKLLPPTVKRRWDQRKLQKAHYSMSLFVWYFGTNRQYHDVAHHTIMLGPRYRELLDDIFKRKVLADDFSLYLHRPTATDPSLAPPGCDGFYVLSPVPNLAGNVDWQTQAEPYRQRIADFLASTLLPDLNRHVVTSRLLTPIDFRDRLLSMQGAAFSLEPLLTQSAWFRPHNRSEDIENLFLVGAGTHPGAGLPGVLSSARVLDRIVPDPTVVRARA